MFLAALERSSSSGATQGCETAPSAISNCLAAVVSSTFRLRRERSTVHVYLPAGRTFSGTQTGSSDVRRTCRLRSRAVDHLQPVSAPRRRRCSPPGETRAEKRRALLLGRAGRNCHSRAAIWGRRRPGLRLGRSTATRAPRSARGLEASVWLSLTSVRSFHARNRRISGSSRQYTGSGRPGKLAPLAWNAPLPISWGV